MLLSLLLLAQITATPSPPLQRACPTVYPGAPLPVTHSLLANQICEKVYLDGPNNVMAGDERPLLVLFHGFAAPAGAPAGTHQEFLSSYWNNHDLMAAALARGWFVMMHDGGDVGWFVPSMSGGPLFYSTYGADRFQKATRKALQFVVNNYPVDPDRIYGYGFSMGGGEVLSYAARHLDPTEPMFAAAVVHSTYHIIYQTLENGNSGAGVEKTYAYPSPTPLPYCGNEFDWRRANVVDFNASVIDPLTCTWSATPTAADISIIDSQLQNLAYQPYRAFYTTTETAPNKVPWLATMNDIVDDWRALHYPISVTETTAVICGAPCGSQGTSCPANGHNWSAVCAQDALDWFDDGVNPKRLRDWWSLVNANGFTYGNRTLLTEDGKRYFYFRAERTLATDFGRLRWEVYPPSHPTTPNRLNILGLGAIPINISTLTIEAGNDGFGVLDTTVSQFLRLQTPEDIDLEVVGYASSPMRVFLEAPSGDQPWPFLFNSGVLTFDGAPGVNTFRIERF